MDVLYSVENNTVDGMEGNQAQSRRSESSSTETMPDVAVAIARMPGEDHCDRNKAKVETDRFQGVGHHARFPHSVTEAGSNVLHVSNSMNEVKKDDEGSEDGEEEGVTAAARENDEISRKDAEIRRQGKQRVKELSKSFQKMYQRQEKSEKTTRNPKNLEDFKGVSNIPGIRSAKKKVLITKIKTERGEIIMSCKGFANVFGECYKKLYDDNEQDEYGNESNIDVHTNDDNTRDPE